VAGCEWCVARFDGYGGRDVLVGRKAAVWGNANVTVRKRRVVDGDIFVCFIITQGGIDGCRGERVVVEELTIRVIGECSGRLASRFFKALFHRESQKYYLLRIIKIKGDFLAPNITDAKQYLYRTPKQSSIS
jgi:hypothetical protein